MGEAVPCSCSPTRLLTPRTRACPPPPPARQLLLLGKELCNAAACGCTARVCHLLAAAPAAARVPGHRGRLALHLAAGVHSSGGVRLLLEAAPDTVTARDDDGRLPLDHAMRYVLPVPDLIFTWAPSQLKTARVLIAAPARRRARSSSRSAAGTAGSSSGRLNQAAACCRR